VFRPAGATNQEGNCSTRDGKYPKQSHSRVRLGLRISCGDRPGRTLSYVRFN
jgi:hypothetical protein